MSFTSENMLGRNTQEASTFRTTPLNQTRSTPTETKKQPLADVVPSITVVGAEAGQLRQIEAPWAL